MQLLSIQIGSAQLIDTPRPAKTGIFKHPVERATLTATGVVGDAVVDTKHHGGPGQAVYVYSAEDYAFWAAELGITLHPGQFGENLTMDTVGPETLRIGDRFTIGDGPAPVVIEVSSCRVPCGTFSARMDGPDWIRRFRDARRPGFYARVIVEGQVRSGDPIRRRLAPESNITMLETQDLFYDAPSDITVERVMAALASPVANRNVVEYEAMLARLTG